MGADLAVSERGSNLGALSAAEDVDVASILCLLAAGDSFADAGAGDSRAEAGVTTPWTLSMGATERFCLGACFLNWCAVRFWAKRALAVCFERLDETDADPAAGAAKLSMSPSSLSSIVAVVMPSLSASTTGCLNGDVVDQCEPPRNEPGRSQLELGVWLRVLHVFHSRWPELFVFLSLSTLHSDCQKRKKNPQERKKKKDSNNHESFLKFSSELHAAANFFIRFPRIVNGRSNH